jgi:uncharacterized protein (DUF697 family)
MSTDERESRRGFLAFADLKAWAVPRLRALVEDSGLREHQDTLDRLLSGNFKDLTPEQRGKRIEEIIQVSATASVGMAAVPIPFLDLPILMAMVGAIGRVHGLSQQDNRLWYQVLGTLGGGLFLRQVLRVVPFGSALYASQIYGATWALGQVANQVCINGTPPSADALTQIFEDTLQRKSKEHQTRKQQPGNAEARLRELADLRQKGLISEEEFRQKRAEILARL